MPQLQGLRLQMRRRLVNGEWRNQRVSDASGAGFALRKSTLVRQTWSEQHTHTWIACTPWCSNAALGKFTYQRSSTHRTFYDRSIFPAQFERMYLGISARIHNS